MALRDKLAERSYPMLEPGEQIHHVFMAQTGPNPWLGALTNLMWFWVKTYVIVVTDRAIVVLRASTWVPSKPKAFYKRLPRVTVLGPVDGLWGKMSIEGERFYVHKRFHKDVTAADQQIAHLGAVQQQAWHPQQQPQQPGQQFG